MVSSWAPYPRTGPARRDGVTLIRVSPVILLLVGGRATVDSLTTALLGRETAPSVETWMAAAALVALNEPSRALSVLERIQPRGAHLYRDLGLPAFDPIRTNPCYASLIETSRPPGSPPP